MTFLTRPHRQSITALTTVLPLALLLAAVPLLSAAVREEQVELNGRVEDCFRGSQYAVAGMEMSAFGPGEGRALVALLGKVDRRDRDNPNHWRLVELLRSSAALARDTTDNGGTFALRVPRQDSVLVVGRPSLEDEPYYYSYVVVGARADTSIVLDRAGGVCVAPPRRSQRIAIRV